MESQGRSVVLALVAAGLLVVNLAVLLGGNGTPDAVEESPSAVDGPDGTGDADGEDGDGEGDGEDGEGPGPGPDDPDPTTDEDGPGGDGGVGDGTDDGPDRPTVALTAPADGTYRYDSSGSWSVRGGGDATTVVLPATATLDVTVLKGGGWTARLAAGQGLRETLTFEFTGRDGFDWTEWSMARALVGGSSTTAFACSSDDDWYRAGGVGRAVTHVCRRSGGGTLTSTVEHVGVDDVTLGDGEVVEADHLVQVGTLDGADVAGEVRLDLWLDPATGLRVREERMITTTTTVGGGERTYREDVTLRLVSRE